MKIGRWTISGFAYFDTGLSAWAGFSLFQPRPGFVDEKIFVFDGWIPFFGVRFELRKDVK